MAKKVTVCWSESKDRLTFITKLTVSTSWRLLLATDVADRNVPVMITEIFYLSTGRSTECIRKKKKNQNKHTLFLIIRTSNSTMF